jgi:hypothetical protein
MVAARNLRVPSGDRVGVLIVTRQTDEADRLAAEINATFQGMVVTPKEWDTDTVRIVQSRCPVSPHPIAVARHSKPTGRASRETVRKADILILTHASYVAALDRLEQAEDDRWSSMIEWEGGTRHLSVIDETITSLLETYRIDIDAIKRVLAYVPERVRDRFPSQVQTLEKLVEILRHMRQHREIVSEAKKVSGDTSPAAPDAYVWDRLSRWKTGEVEMFGNMGGLRREMLRLNGLISEDNGGGSMTATPIAKLADETLKAVEMFVNRWMVYHHHYKEGDTLNHTRLIFPDNIPAPVVLDATADEAVLWHLLGPERVRLVDIPRGSRSYSNMTLHVAYADGLGLASMRKAKVAGHRVHRLLNYLNARMAGQDRKALLVLHKDAEYHAKGHPITGLKALSTAHYGAIDGLNGWSDCDTVAILGMDYRDEAWVNGLFAAMEDHKGNTPEIGAVIRQTDDTYRDMSRRQLTVSIVQALNRVRCRRVVNSDGDCAACEGFIFLPKRDGLGEAILEGIKREMPGLVVKDWDFTLDAPAMVIREGSAHAKLLAFMQSAAPGEVDLKVWSKRQGLSIRVHKDLMFTLRDSTHSLTKALAEIGVSYASIGQGRGAKSLLVKRPIAIAA